MNFLALEYFISVAEEMNITKAAERHFISQQSLSNQIIKLEKELGIQLFERSPSLSLTYAGTRFLRAANKIIDEKRQILREIDDINNNCRGEIKVGFFLENLRHKFSWHYQKQSIGHKRDGFDSL